MCRSIVLNCIAIIKVILFLNTQSTDLFSKSYLNLIEFGNKQYRCGKFINFFLEYCISSNNICLTGNYFKIFGDKKKLLWKLSQIIGMTKIYNKIFWSLLHWILNSSWFENLYSSWILHFYFKKFLLWTKITNWIMEICTKSFNETPRLASFCLLHYYY